MWLECLKAMLHRKNAHKPIKILWMIDFENLVISAQEKFPPERYSLEAGFENIIQILTDEIGGEIVGIYAFIPQNKALVWGATIYKLGFHIILCPKIRDKKGREKDTTDGELINFAEEYINNTYGITHFCLGGGDKDYDRLLRKVKQKGLKRIIVAGSLSSLHANIAELADRKPDGINRMIYLFSPVAEGQKIS